MLDTRGEERGNSVVRSRGTSPRVVQTSCRLNCLHIGLSRCISQEVGLPVGRELKGIIATKLDLRFEHFNKQIGRGDLDILEVLRRNYRDINPMLHVCWQIREGIELSPSIDDYIDAHKHNVNIGICGKLGIASSILKAERNSKLFYKRMNIYDTINFDSIRGTWYSGFYELLSQGVSRQNIETLFKNTTVICFNYDRCLEHFLVHALSANYHIENKDARILVEKLPVIRPYGSVGRYFSPPQEIVEFGANRLPPLEKIVENLKTYTEQVENMQSLADIHEAISEAKVVVFLGNHFHKNNIDLLVREKPTKPKRIYFTRHGISDHDIPVIIDQLARFSGAQTTDSEAYRHADKCHQLFDDYRLSLRQ